MTTTINNEHKKLNVPNLRFPEFQGEWEEHLLGNISDVTKLAGFEFTKYVTYEDNGNIIAIRGLNCKNGSLDLRDVKYIDNSDFSKLSRSKLYTGDILYTYVGTVGEVAVVDKNDKYYLAPNVSRIRLSKDYNSDFIKQLLGSKKFYNQIVFPLIATSSQPALSMENLRKFKLKVPSIREQTKIASLLNAIDERIATQNKIIEDLKKLKSAISHILFSSKGAIHLSEIANVVMGQSPSSNAYNDQGLGMPLVQGNLDISNGKTTPRLYTAEFNQTTEKGNIILTVRAPVGEVAKATQKVCLGRGVCAIIPHEENMSDFIYQYLTFYKFMWRRYEQGSTFTSINGSDVRNIFCPKVRNVSILTLLDIKINIEERVVKQYQSQKQYMLYHMFI